MNNEILDVIKAISDLTRYEVYFDEIDKKWHIDFEGALQFFDSKDEAEKTVDKMMCLAIISKVANALNLDFGFDGKIVTIKID
jgi:hypothetical protein